MTLMKIDIDSNISEGLKTSRELEKRIPEYNDRAARNVTEGYKREAKRTMLSNDSVVTGQGLRSLEIRRAGSSFSVWGNSYLKDLDQGTSAHVPNMNNNRFIAASRSYGMSRFELASIIAKKGTRPHEWMDETERIARKRGRKKAVNYLQKAIVDSL